MSVKSPVAILFDINGNPMAIANGASIPASGIGFFALGADGSTARFVRLASDGTLRIDPTGSTTQPISAASLPLPSGAATELTLASIDATASGLATQVTLDNLYTTAQTLATESTLALLESKDFATEYTLSGLNSKDFATETTLNDIYTTAQTLATESTLGILAAKDFATETTLASIDATASGLATENSLLNFRNDFNNENFAQESTLATLAKETTVSGQLQHLINKDFATETTLSAFRTNFINEDFAQQVTLSGLRSDFQAEDFAQQTTLSAIKATTDNIQVSGTQIRNASGTKLQISSAGQARTVLYDDTYNNPIALHSGVLIPNNTGHLFIGGRDQSGYGRPATMVEDENIDGLWRLAIDGKVSITVPPPPPGGTKVAYYADNPLEVSQAISPYLTAYILPAGKTLYIQQIVAGCQGDPSADGSKVEVYYFNGTNHLIDRIYVVGETQFGNYPDTSTARDGTLMVGNGTTYAIRIYRSRLSNSTQEIDAIVRGYVI